MYNMNDLYKNYYDNYRQYDDVYGYIKDYGAEPFVININEITKQNKNFRTALWTGQHLQITLMSINVGESIGFKWVIIKIILILKEKYVMILLS